MTNLDSGRVSTVKENFIDSDPVKESDYKILTVMKLNKNNVYVVFIHIFDV